MKAPLLEHVRLCTFRLSLTAHCPLTSTPADRTIRTNEQIANMPFFSRMKSILHHPILSQPGVSLGLTALSLLLLVLVLLSVPGPIKGFYWFRVDGQESGMGPMTAGVLGWCETNTSNCTYAPLS